MDRVVYELAERRDLLGFRPKVGGVSHQLRVGAVLTLVRQFLESLSNTTLRGPHWPDATQDVFPIAELCLCNLRGQFDISADAVPSATTNHVIRGRASFCRVVGI